MQPEMYDPKVIEPRWQQYWEEKGIFRALRIIPGRSTTA